MNSIMWEVYEQVQGHLGGGELGQPPQAPLFGGPHRAGQEPGRAAAAPPLT